MRRNSQATSPVWHAAKGVLLNEAAQRAFSYDDACVERGASFNHDPAASQAQAAAAVNSLLKVVCKID